MPVIKDMTKPVAPRQGATPRVEGVRRGKRIVDGLTKSGTDGVPSIPPHRSQEPNKGGSPYEITLKGTPVPPVATRPTPKADTSNPIK